MAPIRPDVLQELRRDARSHLSVNERGRIHLIPLADVLFLKAELKYVTVRTAEREFLLEESLAKLEQEFFGCFVRIHRNCLVAKEAIRGFERGVGVDADGDGGWSVVLNHVVEKLPVSRRQQHIVREFGRIL
jgi:two-component system, LytTR family, response regulator AlgR